MGEPFIPAAYLELAEWLADGRVALADLPQHAASLPSLDHSLLDNLAAHADHLALAQPKQGWAVTAVAEAAAAHADDLLLPGLAAWYVARAGNAWVRPDVVQTAVARARAVFTQLGETGWLAACDWQENALPWTCPDFTHAAAILTNALHHLEIANFHHLIPDCRLSQANANLLIGQFEEAARQITMAEQTFQEKGDRLGLGRCLYTRAAALRRQTHFEAARECLTQALTCFQEGGAAVYAAITTTQLGFISWWWHYDQETAESNLKWAAEHFAAQEMPLWLAQSQFGLAQIYQQTGQLAAASKLLLAARETFAQFHLVGLWADSLLEGGWLALYQGQYETSLDCFRQAELLYTQIGNRWLPVVAAMHQGEAYLQMGWYQRALQLLEEAHGRLVALAMPQRIAACEMRLAQLYLQLNQYEQSHLYLDEAEIHFQQCGPTDAYQVLYVYNLRAELLFLAKKEGEGIQFLQKGLALAQEQGDKAYIAQAQRLLGQALCAIGRPTEAHPYLQAADATFAEMDMFIERATCQVAWGHYHQQLGNISPAQAAWESALALSQNVIPDIIWQAQAGLATLSIAAKADQVALAHYRQMVSVLARLRQGLWQPALAGSFMMRLLPHLDTAVLLATRLASSANTTHAAPLFFIEAGKAHTAARQLAVPAANTGQSQTSTLSDLTAEINWLQEKLRANYTAGPTYKDRVRWQQQLVEKVKIYDRLKSRLERQQVDVAWPSVSTEFDQEQFRQQANRALGQNWLALNYYLTNESLCGVMLSPDECRAWTAPITGAISLALKTAIQLEATAPMLAVQSLRRLGSWLFPAWVQERLTPETILLLSPHQQLHRLPWPILHLGEAPLVMACIPVIIPSFQALVGLWQRPSPRPSPPSPAQLTGLLVAVSAFQGRHPALPAISTEAAAISPWLGDNGQTLTDTAVTWPHLQAIAGTTGLAAHFSFWHLASHAFYDSLSGRFSGVALFDRDIWLDEVRQLGPLPPLVTLSACSGGHSLVYAGDEHVSLTLTCLAAGAQSVISSLWPVRDEVMPELMQSFYHYYTQDGIRPAEALALAQRHAWRSGLPAAQWGGLQCFGQP